MRTQEKLFLINLIRRKKNNYRRPLPPVLPTARVNHQITAAQVRLIGPAGENLGVVTKEEALKAAVAAGLDLVEVGAKAEPPVAKIISFDKYRYQQGKLARKQKQTQKGGELRHMRITPRAATNDLERKLGQVVDFLKGGDKVEIQLFLKGREKANRDFAKRKLQEFMAKISTPYAVTMPIRYTGRGFTAQVVGKK